MVVLSAAVTSKTSTLVARQFVEVTRIRIQGLLSAFLKLIENGGKDHTYIETESVRYVYQPVESLFILLITNKQSNILEDLETIRLLGLIAQDVCHDTVTEELILQNAFQLVFAFDEVISFGYRESALLKDIKSYTMMESFEEECQSRIKQNKAEQEKKRRDALVKQMGIDRMRKQRENVWEVPQTTFRDFITAIEMSPHIEQYGLEFDNTSYLRQAAPYSGMKLGTKSKQTTLAETLQLTKTEESKGTKEVDKPSHIEEPTLSEPISVTISERIVGRLQLDGGLESVTGDGALQIVVHNAEEASLAALHIEAKDEFFRFQVHPSMSKAEYAKGCLQLKDPTQPFQAKAIASLLKWRLTKPSEELLPISISYWPSSTPSGSTVSIELELADPQYELKNVHIQIMSPADSGLQINSITNGYFEEDGVTLHWKIPILKEGSSSGILEFQTTLDSSSLVPLTLEAMSETPLSRTKVLDCFNMTTNKPISMNLKQTTAFSFTVGS